MTDLAAKLECPECGAPMTLRPSRFGRFYGCVRYPACDGAHGAHPDGKPLGRPANKETKLARHAAHESFDRLWKSKLLKRREAYRVLQILMVMTAEEAHIGNFDRSQCEQLMEKLACDAAVNAAIQQVVREPQSDRKKAKAKAYWKRRKTRKAKGEA